MLIKDLLFLNTPNPNPPLPRSPTSGTTITNYYHIFHWQPSNRYYLSSHALSVRTLTDNVSFKKSKLCTSADIVYT